MKRRDCLKAGLTLPLLPMLLKAGPAVAAGAARVRPGTAAWPAAAAWEQLSRAVGGRLSVPQSPFLADPATRAAALEQLRQLDAALPAGVQVWLGGANARYLHEALGLERVRAVNDPGLLALLGRKIA